MQELITKMVDLPFARMFVLGGIVFLLLAVLGKVEGKIDPGKTGRMGALALGLALMAVGVVLQYTSLHDIDATGIAQQARERARNDASDAAGDAASNSSGKAAETAMQAIQPARPGGGAALKIVSGTYGRSCNAKPGNDTVPLAHACDGKQSCDFAVVPVAIEGAPAACARDFAAEWKCGGGSVVYSATLPPGTGANEKLHLACAG